MIFVVQYSIESLIHIVCCEYCVSKLIYIHYIERKRENDNIRIFACLKLLPINRRYNNKHCHIRVCLYFEIGFPFLISFHSFWNRSSKRTFNVCFNFQISFERNEMYATFCLERVKSGKSCLLVRLPRKKERKKERDEK